MVLFSAMISAVRPGHIDKRSNFVLIRIAR
jgi:hypothetical protein